MAKTSETVESQVVKLRARIESAQAKLRKKEWDLAASNNPVLQEKLARLKNLKKERGTAARLTALFKKRAVTLSRQLREKEEEIAKQIELYTTANAAVVLIENEILESEAPAGLVK
jgi:uncharacterized protein involved in exopolysaccharide biosynthesis